MTLSKTSLRIAAAMTAVGIAISLTGCSNEGGGEPSETATIVFASHTDERSGEMQEVQWWMDRVNELTDDAVTFEASYSAALVPAADVFAAIKDGRVDAGYHAAFYNPAEFPLSQVASVPFVTTNAEAHTTALDRLFEDNDGFSAEYLDQGVRPVFFIPLGSSAIGTKEPIESISDLKGKTLRSGGLVVNALEMVGAEPIAMGFDEVYQALERGVIDGYSSVQMTSAYASGLLEVAEYITNPGIGNYVASSFLINEDVWQGLPESIRDAMTQASLEFRTEGPSIIAEVASEVCTSVLEDGGSVTVWSGEAIEEWKEAVGDDILNSWVESVTSEKVSADEARATYDQFSDLVTEIEAASSSTDPMTECAGR